mmetsp:Transcript_74088/g.196842  ORF Transcript_74088/g.196842 Transcript_74088/m.196842 type:complete len:263 (+) Transcript_74088:382-1170(+)
MSPSHRSILAGSLRLPHTMQGLTRHKRQNHSPSGCLANGGLLQARWQKRPQSFAAQLTISLSSPGRPQNMQRGTPQPALRLLQTSQSHSPAGTSSRGGRQHLMWQARPQPGPSQRRSWSSPSGLPQVMHRTSSSNRWGACLGWAQRLSLAMVNSHCRGLWLDMTRGTMSPTAMPFACTKSCQPRHRNFVPLVAPRGQVTLTAMPRSFSVPRGTKTTLEEGGKCWACALGTLTKSKPVLFIRFENCGRPGEIGAEGFPQDGPP